MPLRQQDACYDPRDLGSSSTMLPFTGDVEGIALSLINLTIDERRSPQAHVHKFIADLNLIFFQLMEAQL
ncbi:hypothetical protein H6770_00230 [Candidatus Peribacteria bacterium]|nr:hypothetical protein [Candidatus Peribacteria bacterium]